MSTVLVLFQLQGGRKKKGRHYILNCQRFEYGLHINGLGFRYTDLFFFQCIFHSTISVVK